MRNKPSWYGEHRSLGCPFMFTCSRSCYPSLLMRNPRNVVNEIFLGRSWNGVLYVLLAAPGLTYTVSLTAISSNLIRTRINLPVTSQIPREVFLSLQNTYTGTVCTYYRPKTGWLWFLFPSSDHDYLVSFRFVSASLKNACQTMPSNQILILFWQFQVHLNPCGSDDSSIFMTCTIWCLLIRPIGVEPVDLKGLRLSSSTF